MPRKKLDNVQITFRLDAMTLASLREIADEEHRSINAQASLFIEEGIENWLNAREPKPSNVIESTRPQ